MATSSEFTGTIDTKDFLHHAIPKQQSERRGGTTMVVNAAGYEPAPPEFGSEKQTRCQWCLKDIGQDMVQSGGKWSKSGKRHFLNDLLPWMCLSEACSDSRRPLFASLSSWNRHMESHDPNWPQVIHQQSMWKCCVTEHDTDVVFSTKEELHGHIRLVHADASGIGDPEKQHELNESIDERLIARSHSKHIETCPLCLMRPEEPTIEKHNSSLDSFHPESVSTAKREGDSLQNIGSKRRRLTGTTIENDKEPIQQKTMISHISGHLLFLMVLSLRLNAVMAQADASEEHATSDSVAVSNATLEDRDVSRLEESASDVSLEDAEEAQWTDLEHETGKSGSYNSAEVAELDEAVDWEEYGPKVRAYGPVDPSICANFHHSSGLVDTPEVRMDRTPGDESVSLPTDQEQLNRRGFLHTPNNPEEPEEADFTRLFADYDLVGRSICDSCQNFGDMRSPRGFLMKRAHGDEDSPPGSYVYTYVHHSDIVALFECAKAKCCVCRMLCYAFKRQEGDNFDQAIARHSMTSGCAQPRPAEQVAQSDGEGLRVMHFAEAMKQAMKRRGFYRLSDLGIHGDGMIIMQSYSDEESGPRGTKGGSIQRLHLYSLGVPLLQGYVNCFSSFGDPLDPELEHRPAKDLLSEPHIALINRWRHTCETEHESCNENALTQPLPSRVLELLDPNDKERGVRLIETHCRLKGKYACLSYCWGDSETQLGQTTRGNLERQLQGISFHDLPNTVIDAIRLCYKLGFRFLWVDRLCIVQDDEKDWLQQASRMCEVYGRSALTISVPICKKSSQSFLARRRKGPREQGLFTSVIHEEAESKCKSSVCFGKYEGRKDGPWFLEDDWGSFSERDNNSNDHWLERGWTFQEWMLSPRVLHIESMTLWDCFDGYANEVNRRHMEKPRLLRNPLELGEGLSWDFLVREYLKRKVTREEDKLPALAGLATRYAQVTRHTYLAGLWREDLPRSLLWEAQDPLGPRNRRAPSWSWASLDGTVRFPKDLEHFTARASISSFFCQYKPPGSFTAVEKAWIDVEGRVSTVTAQDFSDDFPQRGDVMVGEGEDNEWWYADLDHGGRLPDDSIDQANVCLLLLGSNLDMEDGESYCFCQYALVLQECDGEDGRQCYQRLGTASAYTDGDELSEFVASWETRVVRLV